ncbi:MAG: 4-hydroxy-tetrahydrodipicolinate reductase [Alphaproteobacteria bacterium]|nr:4-hydroxy-tetrahydrodipicolinate reductase [Alphaproteobacteria bacterium]
MINVGVLGITGRMGKTMVDALENHPRCRLSEPNPSAREDLTSLFEKSEVVVDFTSAAALANHISLSLNQKKPLVIGTSGLQASHHQLISEAAKHIPLVIAPNTSVGITLLVSLVYKVAGLLDENYDIEITDVHHRYKKDAPSGAALLFGHSAAKGRGKLLEDVRYDSSTPGERKKGSIGFSSQRGGSVIGDHTIRFMGDEEMLEFSHRGFSRILYAKGAIRAAEWIMTQKPGIYTMADVLQL